ncbi:MAG: crossover junction endodeoxyribonuclease RuvC [Candidatus Nanopelagicales bacterium]|nr:crossover junction endodeoxyribonuclease RuvC [Candidatus Nanopelagicales bacterium]
MRVMGVDPGLTRCGVAIIDGAPGRTLSAMHIGVLVTAPATPIELRLAAIERGINDLVDQYGPDIIAIERVFSQRNVRSAMGTAQAAAIALVIAGRRGITVAMHTPTEVKAAVTGSGRADKVQVTAMVTRILGLSEAPKPADAADAVAIAVCQIWRGSAQRRIADAIAAGAR